MTDSTSSSQVVCDFDNAVVVRLPGHNAPLCGVLNDDRTFHGVTLCPLVVAVIVYVYVLKVEGLVSRIER